MGHLKLSFKLLTLMLFTFILFSCHPAHANNPEWITHVTKGQVKFSEAIKISKAIYATAFKYKINPDLLFRIAKVESNFNRKAKAGGSIGLFQVIPSYHKDKIKGRNLYEVEVAADVGAQIYLEYLENYRTSNKALRAYNGSKYSNKYPLKIAAVKFKSYPKPYPGSNDLNATQTFYDTSGDKMSALDIQPIFQHDFKLVYGDESINKFQCSRCKKIELNTSAPEANYIFKLEECLEEPLDLTKV